MTINNETTVRKIHDITVRELDTYLHEAFFNSGSSGLPVCSRLDTFGVIYLSYYIYSPFSKNSSGGQFIILPNFAKKGRSWLQL